MTISKAASPTGEPLITDEMRNAGAARRASREAADDLDRGYLRARDILIEHRDEVVRLAEHLVEVREIDAAGFPRMMVVPGITADFSSR